MPKKKKSLKQKKQTDLRRQVVQEVTRSSVTTLNNPSSKESVQEPQTVTQSTTFTLPTTHTKAHARPIATPVSQSATITINTSEYNYLGKDLLKTGFLTVFIVVAEFVIKFFFERG